MTAVHDTSNHAAPEQEPAPATPTNGIGALSPTGDKRAFLQSVVIAEQAEEEFFQRYNRYPNFQRPLELVRLAEVVDIIGCIERDEAREDPVGLNRYDIAHAFLRDSLRRFGPISEDAISREIDCTQLDSTPEELSRLCVDAVMGHKYYSAPASDLAFRIEQLDELERLGFNDELSERLPRLLESFQQYNRCVRTSSGHPRWQEIGSRMRDSFNNVVAYSVMALQMVKSREPGTVFGDDCPDNFEALKRYYRWMVSARDDE